MASVEERFQAAVNVIKGLPKNGPYQPSMTMMLKFYGYFKQATEGPCTTRKPAFWDVIGKAKWEAWNGNRHLSKQQAMQKYVDDLREIIETMSFTENVQNFVGAVNGLNNINLDELEMIAPGVREMAQSHPNSPFTSRPSSPQHGESATVNGEGAAEKLHRVPSTNGHAPLINGNDGLSDIDDDLTSTPPPLLVQPVPIRPSAAPLSMQSVEQSDDEYGDPIDLQHDIVEVVETNSVLLRQIQATIVRMNNDVGALNQRMISVEKTLQDMRSVMQKSGCRDSRSRPKWWPLTDISPMWFMVLILWPFVVKRLTRMLANDGRRK